MAKGRGTVLPLPDGIPERLEGGYKNELLRYGDVVLRLERSTLERVGWEHDLLRWLDLPEVVAPLAGPELWEDGRIASLFPYIRGTILDRDDPEQRHRLARLLAALHRRGLAWEGGQRPGASSWPERDLVRNDWWDWTVVEHPPVLVRAYEEMTAFLLDPPQLTTGIVHGDVYRGNLRVHEGTIVGMIDWEEARLDWQAWELANAAWEVGERDRFVAAYLAAGGPAETEHLDAFTRFRNVADVLYSLTSKARGEPYSQEYVDHLLRALA
jgi:Ser/Thr protein kinase RdoA (MazF antagonist)